MYTEYIYFPITLIVVSGLYFLIHTILIKSDYSYSIAGLKRKPIKFIDRLPIYLFLSILIIILPFTIVMFLMFFGGLIGVVSGAFVGLFIANFIIAKLFLDFNSVVKMLILILVFITSIALSIIIYKKELIKTDLFENLYFDINISLIISSILCWEIFFQVNKLIKQRKNSISE